LNPQLVQDKFAEVWDLDPSKLFQQQQPVQPVEQGTQQAPIPQNKPVGVQTGMQKPTVNQLMQNIGNKALV
jgi:hypothetical protein